MRLAGTGNAVREYRDIVSLKERLEVWMDYSMININMQGSTNASARRTFRGVQCLLGCGLVVDRIEGKGEVLGLVPRIRDLDDSIGTIRVDTVCPDDGVLIRLRLLQKGPYPCNNANRHDEASKLLGLVNEKRRKRDEAKTQAPIAASEVAVEVLKGKRLQSQDWRWTCTKQS